MEPKLNADSKEIKILFSKNRLVIIFFISLCFVAGGLFCVVNPSEITRTTLHHPPKEFVFIIGAVCLLMGILGLCFTTYKIFHPKPALIINDAGIYMNGETLIKWGEITRISMETIQSQNFIAFYLKDPQDYIDRIESSFKQRLARALYGKFGYYSISIATYSLECDKDNLFALLSERVAEYQKAERVNHSGS